MLELNIPIEQHPNHFDKNAESYLKQSVQVLESSTVPAMTNYAVGVFRDGQVHLTPLCGVLQMKPSFAHIDNAPDEEEDDLNGFIVDDTNMMEVVEEETKGNEPPTTETQQVQMLFKKRESERAIAYRERSYAHKRSLQNAEAWVDLAIKGPQVSAVSVGKNEITSAHSP